MISRQFIILLFLQFVSGMWKLEVSHNHVSSIPSMAFYGLERALWELHLPHNKLTRIPSDSLTLLKKLSVLNLAGKLKTFPTAIRDSRHKVFSIYTTT
jgi:Leucine-rich repeat (LRR) protein